MAGPRVPLSAGPTPPWPVVPIPRPSPPPPAARQFPLRPKGSPKSQVVTAKPQPAGPCPSLPGEAPPVLTQRWEAGALGLSRACLGVAASDLPRWVPRLSVSFTRSAGWAAGEGPSLPRSLPAAQNPWLKKGLRWGLEPCQSGRCPSEGRPPTPPPLPASRPACHTWTSASALKSFRAE